ncbi:uncharacterized protein LOC130052877 isoform X1 [Ostrea edulis]|uniref:uncharacterized protein LOC130052877 isoform X1 n=2 Tax=Ostrea edulis TaxID=37623 RepID=UPI0024AF7299|nr:uncharacterized protein LOC130052877 isoform X1 [Ostrea edulis]XP_056015004.1 uncharacterized protein LOC130052877 isoform X1 [Ostrea edulis]
MYGENRVTSEETQRTLGGLKSRGFLWDQDGVDITEDVKDETMYRVTERSIVRSVSMFYVYYISSYTTAVRYLRSWIYTRKSGEKCVISDGPSCDSLLIRRLQMNILTHVIMENTSICDKVSQTLHVPTTILQDMTFDQRQEFIRDLEHSGECVHCRGGSQGSVQHVKWLRRDVINTRPDIVRSCIGLHPHWDIYIINNTAYRKQSKYHEYPDNVRSRLYCLLLAEQHTVNTKGHKHKQQDVLRKIRERYFTKLALSDDVRMRNLTDDIIQTQDEVITFKSDEIRHDVMYAFVTECLVEDSDLKFFLTTASRDVISEYCRSWDYKKGEGERCLYIPDYPGEMYVLFIDRLQLDILTHRTVSDRRIHDSISARLGVPDEILDWDQEARERYVEYAKRGTQTVHHARGMIVGCAGAGKTTLLKRLLRCSDVEIRDVTSTEGLEVHEEIFQICEETKTLKVRSKDIGGKKNSNGTDEKTVTFFDFGGQCAYYACHQIYLTRRSFYMVVVDASKRLDQVVDKEVCDQADTVFAGWTYGEYFIFWLKSVHTYCSTRDGQKVEIIIVASHWENTVYKDKANFLDCLLDVIPAQSDLAQYIREDRCFLIQFPPSQSIAELERCIIDITTQPRWSEKIPHEWVFFNSEINEKKMERIVPISDIHRRLPVKGKEKVQSAADMLRYYHDAGRALFFNEEGLKDSVIIDVQWFVNAFKTIITDRLHVSGYIASRQDWIEYYNTGNLKDSLLIDIWELEEKNINTQNKKADSEHCRGLLHHKGSMLKYMERLGLLAVGHDLHYIPCMNKRKFEETQKKVIQDTTSKTSVLVYVFDFLPYFLFYRVVVACMQIRKWRVLKNNDIKCLYKNAAMFKRKDHYVVILVTSTSIQLQIIRKGDMLIKHITVAIRKRIDQLLKDVTDTFHKHLSFKIGYACMEEQDQIIGLEIEGRFLEESKLGSGKKVKCPHHEMEDYHTVNADYLKRFWK